MNPKQLLSCMGSECPLTPHKFFFFPFFLFFLFFFFFKATLWHIENPRPGVESNPQLQPMPQPQPHQMLHPVGTTIFFKVDL